MYGYWGKILRIDLTDRSISVEEREEDFWRKYLGGEGIAAKILYDEVPKNSDPLGPENRLIFSVGTFPEAGEELSMEMDPHSTEKKGLAEIIISP